MARNQQHSDRKTLQAADGKNAMAEYTAEAKKISERTARLKALRLQKEIESPTPKKGAKKK